MTETEKFMVPKIYIETTLFNTPEEVIIYDQKI